MQTHGVWTEREEAAPAPGPGPGPALNHPCFLDTFSSASRCRVRGRNKRVDLNGHCGQGVPHHVDSSAPGDPEVHARAGEAGDGGGAPAECLRGGEDVRGAGEYTHLFPPNLACSAQLRRFCRPLPDLSMVVLVSRTRLKLVEEIYKTYSVPKVAGSVLFVSFY